MYLNRNLWSLTEGVRDRINISIGMGLAGSVLGMLRLLLMGWLIGQVLGGATLEQVWLTAAGILALMVIYAYWDYLRIMVAHSTAMQVQHRIRTRLFDQLVVLGPAHFSHLRSGEISSAAVEGVEQLEIYFGRFLPQFFVALITPFVIFIIVSFLDFPVALTLLAAALFTLLAPGLFHRWDTENSLRRSQAYRAFASEFLDALQGLVTLKAFGQSKAREAKLARHADALFQSTMWVLATNSLSRGITDIGIALGAVAAIAVSAYRVSHGLMEFEALVMVLLLGVEVFRPLRELRGLLHDGMLAESAEKQVFAVLNAESKISDRGNSAPAELNASVSFDQVTFSYDREKNAQDQSRGLVHNNLNFDIAAGERIGIVGSSGGGKSTIARLLLRFYDPNRGQIRIGNVNIKEMPLDHLRKQFAVVSQDTHLFHGTVRENLLLGNHCANDSDLIRAAKLANAHEFIASLPEGYETMIGERGVRLSGGQKQRLSIARAILRDAPILILDEALSSVDARNEAVIQSALDRLMQGRTTLIMAHRLSSIIGCDRILVLHQGRVVEQGSHTQLIRKQGVYHTLMSSQAADREGESIQSTFVDAQIGSSVTSPENAQEKRQEEVNDVLGLQGDILKSDTYSWRQVLGQLLKFAAPWTGRLVTTFSLGVLRVLAFIGVSLMSAMAAVAVKTGEDYSIWLIGLSVIAIVAALFHWLESWLAHDMAFRMLSKMRIALFQKLDTLAPAFMLRRRSGDLINLATHDIEMVEYFFAHTITPVFVAVLVPSLVLVLLTSFHPMLALTLFPFLLMVGFMPVMMRRRIDRLAGRARQVLGALSAHTIESIQGLGELLSYQATAQRRSQFVDLMGQHQQQRQPFFSEMTKHIVITDFLTVASGLAVILVSISLVSAGDLDAVYLPLLALASMAAFLPVVEISDAGRQLAETFAATNRLIQVHDCEPTVCDVKTDRDQTEQLPQNAVFDIDFNGVHFCYEGQHTPALKDVDLHIPAGSTVALVGASGAGKSTLAHLLLRFWDPTKGTITLANRNLAEFPVDYLRLQVALVAQDTYLFNDTLEANLRMAKPDASDAEVRHAIRSAELEEFIERLPIGLQTRVGERGYALSGGQRQRVSIARAFLRDAPILILDEATSHLDAISERAVHRALHSLMQNRTTLVIAHRLATIRNADQIVVLRNGEIQEQGSHLELLNKQADYARLLNYQITSGKIMDIAET
ncbi:MAG: thiol reductant ABC exporter subunit CydC [Acidiferrobacterales bacterium]|nr:thiol reductant ABC exporter subunit CydC [Acidiferrobacterales bacterium]